MAARVKPWRDAATLILTARLGQSMKVTSTQSLPSKSPSKHVGSVDLDHGTLASKDEKVAKHFVPMTFDYSTLLLTRSVRKNTFFAGSHVFPGGAIDKADFSPKWLELFALAGIRHPNDFGPMVTSRRDRPPVLCQTTPESPVPADVAFRICAIRETFEESGVLLLRGVKDCHALNTSGVSYATVFNLTDAEEKTWRKLVHGNAAEFLMMCEKLQALPDIWALAEWSNWLTPSDNKKRFDTMFYMCSLEDLPVTMHDQQETIHSQWMAPLDALMKYYSEEIYLPPPQIYELQRMCHYGQQRALHQFISDRAFRGCLRFLPVRCNCRDGLLSLLPGDDLYPKDPVVNHLLKPDEVMSTEETMAEVAQRCRRFHRYEFRTVVDYQLVFNLTLPHEHIGPKDIIIKEQSVKSNL